MSDLPKIDVYNFKYQLEAPKPGLTIFKPQGYFYEFHAAEFDF